MKGGHLMHSVCKEVHVFKPFSSGQQGATTEQTVKLTFVGETVSSPEEGKEQRDIYQTHL